MKQNRALSLSLVGLLLVGCGRETVRVDTTVPVNNVPVIQETEVEDENIDLSIWMFPVGNLDNTSTIAALTGKFHEQFPNIHLKFEYLDYTNGDNLIEQAINDGNYPDIVFEGPERLVANWGERGLMVDLSDLWDSQSASEIYDSVENACIHNGYYYEYPICMSTHCMGINLDMLKKANASQYIDMENRTWTADDFVKVVQALYDSGIETVADIYCADKSGDQGSRALVNNLYGGRFTDEAHTKYTVDDEANIKALELLKELPGIKFNSEKNSGEAINDFVSGKTAMVFCWNGALEVQHTLGNDEYNFDTLPVAFPTESDVPNLQGGIWGFGIFNSGDDARIEAAKEFIKFFAFNDEQYKNIVLSSTYWPVRPIEDLYKNDALMTEYSIFNNYAGDYYQVTPGWTEVRQDWATMLQEVGAGKDVREAAAEFMAKREEDSGESPVGGADEPEDGAEE